LEAPNLSARNAINDLQSSCVLEVRRRGLLAGLRAADIFSSSGADPREGEKSRGYATRLMGDFADTCPAIMAPMALARLKPATLGRA
jgi:hypothetical protein